MGIIVILTLINRSLKGNVSVILNQRVLNLMMCN